MGNDWQGYGRLRSAIEKPWKKIRGLFGYECVIKTLSATRDSTFPKQKEKQDKVDRQTARLKMGQRETEQVEQDMGTHNVYECLHYIIV